MLLPGVVALSLVLAGCTGHTNASTSPPPSHAATSAKPSGSAAATPSASPSTEATTAPTGLAAIIAKLPHFAAPPTAIPVKATPGPKAPIYYRLPVTQPVAFLTIDDGIWQEKGDPQVMAAAHVPFTMFLIAPVAARNPAFFRKMVADGGVIEDHTLTHPILRGRSTAFQKNEICTARTKLTSTFKTTPTLFRPPYGDYDSTTLQLVRSCGMRAAFYWSETVNNGKVYYQTPVHKIKAGDIILMHFRPQFAEDVLAALTAIHKAGLTPALLENYLP